MAVWLLSNKRGRSSDVETQVLKSFVVSVCAGYLPNPYHNRWTGVTWHDILTCKLERIGPPPAIALAVLHIDLPSVVGLRLQGAYALERRLEISDKDGHGGRTARRE